MTRRIAIVTNTLGAVSETFVRDHISTLNDGNTVVICRRTEDTWTVSCPVLQIGGNEAGLGSRLGNILRAIWNQVVWGGIALPDAETVQRMADFLRASHATCVLAEFGPAGCIVQRAAALAGLPFYVYFLGKDASSLLRRAGVRRAYRRLFPAAAGVISVSRFLVKQLAARGFTHPNTHVIPSGVDTDLFLPAEKRPASLLFIGRFVPKKAPHLIIQAFAGIAARHPEARLRMIGDGPLLTTCQKLAQTLGIAERIDFMGRQPHTIVRQEEATSAILLQHSITDKQGDTEGLPVCIQEAMSSEALVIATRHAGIPEAIRSGENGWLVEERDVDAMTKAIIEALDHPEQTCAMSSRARRDAIAHFDSRSLRRRLEMILFSDSQPPIHPAS